MSKRSQVLNLSCENEFYLHQNEWSFSYQSSHLHSLQNRAGQRPRATQTFLACNSGRKNVLRKLLRIPYRRLKEGFSACWLCLFVARVLSEMHEVRTFSPCKAFLFDMFAFFSSLENYFGFRTTNVKGKTTEAEKGQSKNILQIQKNILNRNIFLKSLSKSLTNLKKLLQILRKFVDPQITFSIIRKYFANP